MAAPAGRGLGGKQLTCVLYPRPWGPTQAFIGGATWEVFRVALVPALVWRADGKGAGGLCFSGEVVLLSFWTFWSDGCF